MTLNQVTGEDYLEFSFLGACQIIQVNKFIAYVEIFAEDMKNLICFFFFFSQ